MAPKKFARSIVSRGMADPKALLVNPLNHKRHSPEQIQAALAVLGSLGWISEVLVNVRNGRILDGHMRVEIAIAMGQTTVPVRYVDLDEAREAVVLATFDEANREGKWEPVKTEILLSALRTDPNFSGMIATLAAGAGIELGSILPATVTITAVPVPIDAGPAIEPERRPERPPEASEESAMQAAAGDVDQVEIGPIIFESPADQMREWRERLVNSVGRKKSAAAAEVRRRLMMDF